MAEYSENNLSAVIQLGTSRQTFQREDFFDQPGNPLSEKQNSPGGYIKGGANYNLSERANVFFNAGYISRQPNFDAVFPGYANDINPDLKNEKITSFEAGYGFTSEKLKFNVNVYSTNWGNRFITRSNAFTQGQDGTAQLKDIDVTHKGLELEGSYKLTNATNLKAMLSLGDWTYSKDFTYEEFDDNQRSVGTGTLYLKTQK